MNQWSTVFQCLSQNIIRPFEKKELRIRVKLGKSLHFTFFHSKNVVRKIVVQKLRKRKCLILSLAILLIQNCSVHMGPQWPNCTIVTKLYHIVQIGPNCLFWTLLSTLVNIVHIGQYCPYWTILFILDYIVHIGLDYGVV